jgi:hypothetical protein
MSTDLPIISATLNLAVKKLILARPWFENSTGKSPAGFHEAD